MAAENLNLIALRLIRHSDRQSILTAFSRERGRVSLAVAAGTGRGAARMQALTMPLSLLDCMVDIRPGREILTLRSAIPSAPLPSIHSHPVKQLSAMFLAEVLTAVLRDNQGEDRLYDFISGAVSLLDTTDSPRAIANFHIWFLYHLGILLGIEPDTSSYRPGSLLDMRDGLWRTAMPLHGQALDAPDSTAAWLLSRMTAQNMNMFAYTRAERNRLLDGILSYYSIHLTDLTRLHSPSILRDLL